jgi:hypothetical protein
MRTASLLSEILTRALAIDDDRLSGDSLVYEAARITTLVASLGSLRKG